MGAEFGQVLLAGGTGMLSGAAKWLAPRCESLTLVARRPQRLADELGAIALPLDWSVPDADTRLPDGGFDMVISWLHRDGIWLARPLEDLLVSGGRSIRIHGSASINREIRAQTDPDPRADVKRQTVVLGWHETGSGKRWLSNEEISKGVISAIRQPEKETLVVGNTGLVE